MTLGALCAAPEARADWPSFTVVSTGSSGVSFPVGAAIRNWGPTDDVFIAWDLLDPSAGASLITSNTPKFTHFACSNNDDCATASVVVNDDMGSAANFRNVLHPSLAIRRASSLAPIEVKLLQRQHWGDCDGDGDDGFTGAVAGAPERAALELFAYDFDDVNGHDPLTDVKRADTGVFNVCENHGFSRTRFNGAFATTCFTFDPDPLATNNDQVLGCNENSYEGALGWGGHFELSNLKSAVAGDEDHPGLDFFGSAAKLGVVGHRTAFGSAAHQIRAHFPDSGTPPAEPIVELDGGNVDMNNPDAFAANGILYTVWNRGIDGNAGISYRSCDVDGARSGGGTKDCTLLSDWDTATVVVDSTTGNNRGAKFPQLVVDGKNQFVVYQYDSNSTLNVEDTRVMVASRCEGDLTWTVEQVRTPDTAGEDQAVVYGRPSIVLNQFEDTAHVVLTEFAGNYTNGFTLAGITNSDLFWYRKAYTPCP